MDANWTTNGAGQFYLLTIDDKSGQPFDGQKTYRLHVPPNAPVKLYWSATAYDRKTHALIPEASRSSRASNSAGVQQNADSSLDIFFGPKAPTGKESNWLGADERPRIILWPSRFDASYTSRIFPAKSERIKAAAGAGLFPTAMGNKKAPP
jgi:hypothetical protein